MNNEQFKVQHHPLKCEPVDAKLVERMEGMYRLIGTQAGEASECIASMVAIDGTTYDQLGPNVMMIGVPMKPKFIGVAMCTHCIKRAAMLLRDLANTCDDLVKEVEAHGTPLGPKGFQG